MTEGSRICYTVHAFRQTSTSKGTTVRNDAPDSRRDIEESGAFLCARPEDLKDPGREPGANATNKPRKEE